MRWMVVDQTGNRCTCDSKRARTRSCLCDDTGADDACSASEDRTDDHRPRLQILGCKRIPGGDVPKGVDLRSISRQVGRQTIESRPSTMGLRQFVDQALVPAREGPVEVMPLDRGFSHSITIISNGMRCRWSRRIFELAEVKPGRPIDQLRCARLVKGFVLVVAPQESLDEKLRSMGQPKEEASHRRLMLSEPA